MNQMASDLRGATQATATPVPDKFAHVVYRTTAKRPMLDWYRDVLGGRIVFENDFIGFITYDDEHHRVAVVEIPDLVRSEKPAVGLHHVAFTYRNLAELLDTYVRLRDRGIRPVYCTNHGPTTSMYYADPDGNRVELQIDNFPSMAEAAAWFATPEFAENPIGADFEPEDLLRKFKSGVPEAELKRRANVGPRGPRT